MPSTSLRASRLTAVAAASGATNWLNRATWLLFNKAGELSPLVQSGATSMGWLFDQTGTLRARPHNLLLWSEQFDNAVWGAVGGVVTANVTTAPDGTNSADRFIESTGSIDPRFPVSTTLIVGATYTISVYAKLATSSAQRFLMLVFNSGFGAVIGVNFDLQNGAVGTNNGNSVSSITPVGAGWFRCSLTTVVPATSVSGTFRIRFSSVNTAANINNPQPYTGDGTSGIFIWGAQLNQGELQPYYPTTGSAYYGPRVSYDPANLSLGPFLLAEEARTNAIRNNTMQGAVAGVPGTVPTNWAIAQAGTTATVVSTFVEQGVNIIRLRIQGTATGGSGGIRPEASPQQIVAANGQAWTFSPFVRVVGSPVGLVTLSVNVSGFNSVGTFTEGTSGPELRTVAAGGDISARRFAHTHTMTNANTAFVRPQILFTHTSGTTVDFTIDIGLPQLEQAATASSPTLTLGSAVTRSADNLSVANLAATGFNAAGSTVYVDATASNVGALIGFDDGTTNNRFRIGQNDVNVVFVSVFNGTVQNNQFVGTHPVGTRVRAAMRLAPNDFAGATNGVVQFKNAVSSVPPVTRMTIGNAQAVVQLTNGRFFQAAIAPAISDSGLQRMTRI